MQHPQHSARKPEAETQRRTKARVRHFGSSAPVARSIQKRARLGRRHGEKPSLSAESKLAIQKRAPSRALQRARPRSLPSRRRQIRTRVSGRLVPLDGRRGANGRLVRAGPEASGLEHEPCHSLSRGQDSRREPEAAVAPRPPHPTCARACAVADPAHNALRTPYTALTKPSSSATSSAPRNRRERSRCSHFGAPKQRRSKRNASQARSPRRLSDVAASEPAAEQKRR